MNPPPARSGGFFMGSGRMGCMEPISLATLNGLDQVDFVRALGWIFEDSPWVAQQAWVARPFASPEELHQAMTRVVDRAPAQQQLDLICAHPDLGSRARMAAASVSEQQGAGLTSLAPEEYQRLLSLNQQYVQKFGFPFILAVKGKTRHEVFESLEQRLGNGPEAELREALQQIARIAWFRLGDAIIPN